MDFPVELSLLYALLRVRVYLISARSRIVGIFALLSVWEACGVVFSVSLQFAV